MIDWLHIPPSFSRDVRARFLIFSNTIRFHSTKDIVVVADRNAENCALTVFDRKFVISHSLSSIGVAFDGSFDALAVFSAGVEPRSQIKSL